MDTNKYINNICKFAQTEKVLILMRGMSGSGKSTKAKQLGQGGVVLSTDDFFSQSGQYKFDPKKIGEAHNWNQSRALKALSEGVSPIVIDNTNSTSWEMKNYANAARSHGYQIRIEEPDSPWYKTFKKDITPEDKQKLIEELTKRNTHNVPKEAIQRMVDRWQHGITVEDLFKA